MTIQQGAVRNVAHFMERAIEISGKTQAQIAQESGFESANMITMLKQGHTKVPLNRVGPLAKSLGINPAHFLGMVMREYMPDTMDAIMEVLPELILSPSEQVLINAYRQSKQAGVTEPVVLDARKIIAVVTI